MPMLPGRENTQTRARGAWQPWLRFTTFIYLPFWVKKSPPHSQRCDGCVIIPGNISNTKNLTKCNIFSLISVTTCEARRRQVIAATCRSWWQTYLSELFFLGKWSLFKKKKKKAIQNNLLWLAVIDQPNCTTASYLEASLPLRFATCKLDPIAGRDSAGSAVFAHHSCYSEGASIVTIATTLTEEAGWPAVSRVANNSLASLSGCELKVLWDKLLKREGFMRTLS